jgi:pyridoxal phosphate enzyme (YggS family)
MTHPFLATVAAEAARLNVAVPTVVAVTKTHGRDVIDRALAQGLTHIGENYIQEAQRKDLATVPATRHFIGHLQTNKADLAAQLFDVVHTVDSPRLATALEKACAKAQKKLTVFVQVNVAAEPQKSGCAVAELAALVDHVRQQPHLALTGLMTVPPADTDPAPHFARLAQLARTHGLPHLSMGMSADWQTALAHGATHLRLGSLLFGPRGT